PDLARKVPQISEALEKLTRDSAPKPNKTKPVTNSLQSAQALVCTPTVALTSTADHPLLESEQWRSRSRSQTGSGHSGPIGRLPASSDPVRNSPWKPWKTAQSQRLSW